MFWPLFLLCFLLIIWGMLSLFHTSKRLCAIKSALGYCSMESSTPPTICNWVPEYRPAPSTLIKDYTSTIGSALGSFCRSLYLEKPIFPSDVRLIGSFTAFDKSPLAVLLQSTTNPALGFLIFRGTINLTEWIVDFSYSQRRRVKHEQSQFTFVYPELQTRLGVSMDSTSHILIHQGFLRAYEKIKIQLLHYLQQWTPALTGLYVAGHSLGGAICQIAVLDLLVSLPTSVSFVMYTFAAPRVGNVQFATTLNTAPRLWSHYRLANSADIIPTLPWSVMPNYQEPAQPYVFEHAGKLVSFQQQLGSWYRNHNMGNYLRFLG